MDEKPPLNEETLAHFGVKGMKWGVRRNRPDASGVTRTDVKNTRRAEDLKRVEARRSFNKKGLWEQDKEIHLAREQLYKAHSEYATVKADIKARRSEIGKNAAKQALMQARTKRAIVNYKANQETTSEAWARSAVDVIDVMLAGRSSSSVSAYEQLSRSRRGH